MGLNGNYYDRLMAEVVDYRHRVLEAASGPAGDCLVGAPDRRRVGLMVSKVNAIAGDRDSRLEVLSALCGRKLSTANEMLVCEVVGWIRWAMSGDRSDPLVRERAIQAMNALANDAHFQELVRVLPRR